MAVLDYIKKDHIVVITMNRVDSLNALNYELTYALAEAWNRYENDDDAWVAILTGNGRVFCAGRDLKEGVIGGKLVARLADIPIKDPYFEGTLQKPVIAAINGGALGGGYFLAMRSDLRVVSKDAYFQVSEIRWGVPLGIWPEEHSLLRENLSSAVTAELASGMKMTAERAFEVGLINRVVPKEQLMKAAMEMAEHLISVPPLAPNFNLKLLRQIKDSQAVLPGVVNEIAQKNYSEVTNSPDSREAIAAYLEKRKPVFQRK